MNTPMPPRNRIQLHFDVATDDPAAELHAAWEEIIADKRRRLEGVAAELDDIIERARTALQIIVKAIEDSPGSGQVRRLVRLLAGLYNGADYPFDLTDLRALDTELANACIDYLNYDCLAKAEVHTNLPGRGEQMQQCIAREAVRPRFHLSDRDEHELRLPALAARLNRDRDALLREAPEAFLLQRESNTLGALLATQPSPDSDRPLVNARLLSESSMRPACGAIDGPWSPRGFEFTRVTCPDCRALPLYPKDPPP